MILLSLLWDLYAGTLPLSSVLSRIISYRKSALIGLATPDCLRKTHGRFQYVEADFSHQARKDVAFTGRIQSSAPRVIYRLECVDGSNCTACERCRYGDARLGKSKTYRRQQ